MKVLKQWGPAIALVAAILVVLAIGQRSRRREPASGPVDAPRRDSKRLESVVCAIVGSQISRPFPGPGWYVTEIRSHETNLWGLELFSMTPERVDTVAEWDQHQWGVVRYTGSCYTVRLTDGVRYDSRKACQAAIDATPEGGN